MAKRIFGLTGNQLKIIALICMTLDHIGYLLLPQYTILRYIGRLAMPIFAWMIAEGCHHTRNRLTHLLTIAGVATVCQAVYWLTEHSLAQSILTTFTLSTILIYALDFASRNKGFISGVILAATVASIIYICLFLPQKLSGFDIDYGFFGVILPAIIYMGRNREEKLFGASCGMTGLAITLGSMQWFSFAALPLLYLYNGERGKRRLKYVFYIYYPLHLAVLYGITYLI